MERHLTEGLLLTFQAELEREERSPATVEKYLRDVKTFFGFQGNQWVTKEGVIRFKKHLQDRYKPASVNSMLAAVNRPGRCALVSGERCIFYKKEGK